MEWEGRGGVGGEGGGVDTMGRMVGGGGREVDAMGKKVEGGGGGEEGEG